MDDKVLIIGIDSMDPFIVDSMLDKLPNFKGLETYTMLETTIPPETPVAWSAASTGSNPGKYGIFDFINRDPKTYLPKLNLAREKQGIIKTEYVSAMRGTPFWKILSKKKINSTVLRWPVTFPAEKINGKILSGLGVVDIKGTLNNYSYYTNEEYDENEEGKEKIITVEINNNRIETYISGPLIRKSSGIKDVRIPMSIAIKDDEIILNIDKNECSIKPKQWSNMIRVKFKVGVFTEVYAIFKLYLISTNPKFHMYMSSLQIDPENQFVNITYPENYGKELADNIGLFQTLGMPEDTKAVTENKLDESVFYGQINEIENERNKMFFYEFKRFKQGLYAFVFDSGDRLKHIFWNSRDKIKRKALPKEIEDYYLQKDNLIEKVLSKIDENTKLIVFSDHGFADFTYQVNINSWLVKEGYMKIKDNNQNSLFRFVDWKNTQAYSLGFTSLYLNLKGRESQGIIGNDEAEGLTKEIADKLKSLKNNSNPVFTKIYKSKDIYKGNFLDIAPDLILGFSQGYRASWQNAVGGMDKDIIFENKTKWKGDHLIDRSHVPGVLFTNFRINKKSPSIIDIAPTVLKLFNVDIPKSMDGVALV